MWEKWQLQSGKQDTVENCRLHRVWEKSWNFGGFLDTWDKCVPWRQERHVSLVVSTDASSYRWAVIFHFPPRKQKVEITGKRTSAKNKSMSKNLAQFCKPLGAYQHQYETVESMLESITRWRSIPGMDVVRNHLGCSGWPACYSSK